MWSKPKTVQGKGIYHGLPTYPSTKVGNTAIITGANGISGFHMLKVLSQSPSRWAKIYCLSRRPPAVPNGLPVNAEFIKLDFLQSPEGIAEILRDRGVKANYVFFFSYVQAQPKEGGGLWSDAEEMVKLNSAMLSNFLEATVLADTVPKKVMLQTGAKNYGLHLGPTRLPMRESDPRVEFDPNFYYAQEDLLSAFSSTHKIKYTIVMPSAIVGAVPDAAMDLILPLAIYATVQAFLGKKLEFPGDLAAWERPFDLSSAMLNAYLEEWCILRDQSSLGEKWNAADGSAFTWGGFWPTLASWYGIQYSGPELETEKLTSVTSAHDPPPRGFGPPSTSRYAWTFTSWAQQSATQTAWAIISKTNNLFPANLTDFDIERVFGFLDGMVSSSGPILFNLDKLRANGFLGTVSSEECIRETVEDFVSLGMVPPIPVGGKRRRSSTSDRLVYPDTPMEGPMEY